MVDGQGWTPVRELRKGDQLVRPDGSTITIHTIDATGNTVTVHNFEVDGNHNYYVQAGNHWILVHNADCVPRFITTADGRTIDRSSIAERVSCQRQARHVEGDPRFRGPSYFKSHEDAQRVLDAFHDGRAEVLGLKRGDIVVRTPGLTGYSSNPGSGYLDQVADVHFIKGSKSSSVVPTNPARTLMTVPTPEDMGDAPAWDNYCVAQAVQASLRLIPSNTIAIGISISGRDIKFRFELTEMTTSEEEDVTLILEDFDMLTGFVLNLRKQCVVGGSSLFFEHTRIRWIHVARYVGPD